MLERMRGSVKWFDTLRGFGFIKGDDGPDYFVHFSNIRGHGRRSLRDGAPVEFTPGRGPKGLVALDVLEV